MTASDVIVRFETEYQHYHGLTEERVREQQKELRAFEVRSGKPLVECSGPDLGAYLAHLVSTGLHVNTVRKRGNFVRPFYSWAFEKGLVNGDTLMSIRAVRNPKGATGRSIPKPYKAKELAQFRDELAAALPLLPPFRLNYYFTGRAKFAKIARHAQRLQTEAIVGLALYGGLRRQEIYDLSIDDMHPDNEYVVVHGKGDKPREVPHTAHTRRVIQTWLDFRALLEPDHDKPWLSLSPRQPAPGWLKPMRYRRYEELLTDVGNWQLHRFRHTCATEWLRAGMPLEVVSRLLGHANLQQTLAYAELVREDIQRSMEKLEGAFEKQINGTDSQEAA